MNSGLAPAAPISAVHAAHSVRDARASSPNNTVRSPAFRHASPRSRRGIFSLPGESRLFSIVIGFGAVTLFATGCLFVVQIVDDFRDV